MEKQDNKNGSIVQIINLSWIENSLFYYLVYEPYKTQFSQFK